MNAIREGRTELISHSLSQAAEVARRRVRLARNITAVQATVERHQRLRLMLGMAFAVGIFFAALRPGLNVAPLTFLLVVPPFVWMVARTRRWVRYLSRLHRWEKFLARQEQRLRGLAPLELASPHFDGEADIAQRVDRFVAHDLGIFGSYSLWTLLDETITPGGRDELLTELLAIPRTIEAIQARQRQIQEFRREAWFYTKLTFEREAADDFKFSATQLGHLLEEPFVPNWFGFALTGLITLWLGAIACVIFAPGTEFASWTVPLVMTFMLAHYAVMFRVGSTFRKGLGLAHHLGELAPIFAAVEKRVQVSDRVRALCPTTSLAGPSRESRRVGRLLAVLGVETNPLLSLLLNATLPWSSLSSWLLERRRRRVHESLPLCLRELASLEALGSLVIFDRYQTRNYPKLDTEAISFEGLFHPLINREHVIANDFGFKGPRSLGLLTGSNMSGKSTFLRAVGLNQILTNLGAPVFAEAFHTRPLAIETCIEVSDSLRDGVSYFYAEVRRLKALLAHAEGVTENGVLFLIDEIFRGTNNRERQLGSRAVIRALAQARPHAQGFVSTHDLELTVLESQEPAVVNLHFRETIEAGAMVFSYRLLAGPSPTTNALRIMKAEGLPVEIDLTPASLTP